MSYINFAQQVCEEEIAAIKADLWKIDPLPGIVHCAPDQIRADTFPEACQEEPDKTMACGKSFIGGEGESADGLRMPAWEYSLSFSAPSKRLCAPLVSPTVRKNRIGATEIVFEKPLREKELDALAGWLATLDEESGIYRAKGVLQTDTGRLVRLDLAGETVYRKNLLSFDPKKVNRLVLIGQRDKLALVEKEWYKG
mgnify:CR=1 FL=1